MAKQTINLGTTPGDGNGDPLRAALDKVNDNFDEVYAGIDGKAATTHGHAIADVTGLQDDLDGKAATTHGHAIADVTGLQDDLDGKLAKAGGTLEEDAEITFANGSKLKVGTTDAGTGGAGGLAQVCSIQYEKKWEAGLTYTLQQDGATIRTVRDAMSAPGAGHDETKGFAVGTRWIDDNGDVFICRDATEATAVWEAVCDCEIGVALSDETTDLATGTDVVKFSMPFAALVGAACLFAVESIAVKF